MSEIKDSKLLKTVVTISNVFDDPDLLIEEKATGKKFTIKKGNSDKNNYEFIELNNTKKI